MRTRQVAEHLAGDRVVGHLVDADLLRPGAALQEEVVHQVERQVARVEHGVALPCLPERVRRHRALAADDEVVRVAGALDPAERRAHLAVGPPSPAAPVSMPVTVAATSPMCPCSSAPMFEIRS
jgi:hypothetical protein